MSLREPTPEQKKAIETWDRGVSLEAAAGSGKTLTLCWRFIRSLEKKPDAGVLAISFTNKSAREIRERLHEPVSSIIENPDYLLDTSTGTIHNFCSRIVSEFSGESGIEPESSVMDENETFSTRSRIARKVLGRLLNSGGRDDVDSLVAEYGLTDLRSFLLGAAEKRPILQGIFENIVEEGPDGIHERFSEIRKGEFDRRFSPDTAAEMLSFMRSTLDILPSDDVNRDLLSPIMGFLEQRKAGKNITEVDEVLRGAVRYPEKLYKQIKGRRSRDVASLFKKLKACLEQLHELAELFSVEKFNRKFATNIWLLGKLATGFFSEYDEAKADQGFLDFNDLEIGALRALRHDRIASYYRNTLDSIMVDEFQDTNIVQKEILDRIARKDYSNIFVVGDSKQSIYRFRNAEVEIFNEFKKDLANRRLRTNWRSGDRIIGFVNRLFSDLFPESIDSSNMFEAVRDDMVSVEQNMDHGDIDVVFYERGRMEEACAEAIERISRARGYSFSDIAVLMKKMKNNSGIIRAIEKKKIACRVESGGGFYSQPSVLELSSFLEFVDNSDNDLALAALIKSPILGFSDQMLYEIGKREGKSLYEKLLSFVTPERENLHEFVEWFRKTRKKAPVLTAADYLSELDRKYSCSEKYGSVFLQFMELTRRLSSGGRTLSGVVSELRTLVERDAKENVLLSSPSEDGRLRVMTIHGAKGLEFPVVVMADISKGTSSNFAPLSLFDKQLGVSVKVNDQGSERYEKGFAYSLCEEKDKLRELAESKRLLYVGLTRAMSHLVLMVEKPKTKDDGDDAVFRKNNWGKWLRRTVAKGNECGSGFIDELYPVHDAKERQSADSGVSEAEKSSGRPVFTGVITDYSKSRISVTELNRLAKSDGNTDDAAESGSATFSRERDESAAERGTLIHRAFELYHHHMNVEKLTSQMKELGITDSDAECVLEFLGSGGSDFFDDSAEAHAEYSFEYAFAGRIIVGTIDRVVIKDGCARIIDYKTSLFDIEETAQNYRFQLGIYGLALQSVKGVSSIELYLAHVDRKKVVRIDFDPGYVRDVLSRILEKSF